jgi:hypothetical protein
MWGSIAVLAVLIAFWVWAEMRILSEEREEQSEIKKLIQEAEFEFNHRIPFTD